MNNHKKLSYYVFLRLAVKTKIAQNDVIFHHRLSDMQKTSSASSAACVRFVEAVSICLVSWDLFFGASHFCSFETVELAPFSISRTVVSNFWVWPNFYDCILVPKEVTGYKIIYLCSKSIKIKIL